MPEDIQKICPLYNSRVAPPAFLGEIAVMPEANLPISKATCSIMSIYDQSVSNRGGADNPRDEHGFAPRHNRNHANHLSKISKSKSIPSNGVRQTNRKSWNILELKQYMFHQSQRDPPSLQKARLIWLNEKSL